MPASEEVFPLHVAFSFLCRACLRHSPMWCSHNDAEDPPAPGQFWVCPGCARAYRYTLSVEGGEGYLAIRYATAQEIAELEPMCQAALRQAQERVARARVH